MTTDDERLAKAVRRKVIEELIVEADSHYTAFTELRHKLGGQSKIVFEYEGEVPPLTFVPEDDPYYTDNVGSIVATWLRQKLEQS